MSNALLFTLAILGPIGGGALPQQSAAASPQADPVWLTAYKQGRLDDAIRGLEGELPRMCDSPNSKAILCVAALNAIANLAGMTGDADRGERYAKRALALATSVFGARSQEVGEAYDNLGDSQANRGAFREAEDSYRRALAIREIAGTPMSKRASAYFAMARNLFDQDRFAEAEPFARRALELRRLISGEQHDDTAQAYQALGSVLGMLGRREESRNLIERAIAISEARGAQNPLLISHYGAMAIYFRREEEWLQAALFYERALRIATAMRRKEDLRAATLYANIAELRGRLGFSCLAMEYYGRALAIEGRVLRPDHPSPIWSRAGLADALVRTGRIAAGLTQIRIASRASRVRLVGADDERALATERRRGRDIAFRHVKTAWRAMTPARGSIPCRPSMLPGDT